MSTAKLKQIQLGDSATASENVVIEVPLPQDGTFNIKRGDGTDVMTVGLDNRPDFAQGFKSQGQGISPFGRKNVVINGDCRVQQDADFTYTAENFKYAGPDMFASGLSNAGGSFTASKGSLSFGGIDKSTIKLTVNTPNTDISGANFWRGVVTGIEGLNIHHLQGQKAGLSFIFNSNVSGVYSVSFRVFGAAITNGYYLTSFEYTAGAPQKIEIQIPEIPIGAFDYLNLSEAEIVVGFLNSGTLNSATTEQWVTGNANGIAVPNFTNWGATAGNFIELTELQLEPNGVSSFETLSFGEQLALCQRYYEKSYPIDIPPGTNTPNGVSLHRITSDANNLSGTSVEYKVTKRASPTVTGYTLAGILGQWNYERSGVAATQTTFATAGSVSSFYTSINTGAAWVATRISGHWVADARL